MTAVQLVFEAVFTNNNNNSNNVVMQQNETESIEMLLLLFFKQIFELKVYAKEDELLLLWLTEKAETHSLLDRELLLLLSNPFPQENQLLFSSPVYAVVCKLLLLITSPTKINCKSSHIITNNNNNNNKNSFPYLSSLFSIDNNNNNNNEQL